MIKETNLVFTSSYYNIKTQNKGFHCLEKIYYHSNFYMRGEYIIMHYLFIAFISERKKKDQNKSDATVQ